MPARRGRARPPLCDSMPMTSTHDSDGTPSAPAEQAATPEPHPFQHLLRGTLCERMGMRVLELTAAGGVMTMPVEGNTQPAGLLHGGASIALAESIASFAGLLHACTVHGERAQAVGTAVSAVHHRSARTGTVTATCEALHRGRTVATYAVRVTDEAGALLCSSTVSAMLLAPRDA